MHPDATRFDEPVFPDVKFVGSFDSIDDFYQPMRRTAPYGIFPFDHQQCFDLLTGNLLLRTSVNMEAMLTLFRAHNLEFQFPTPDESARTQYLDADIAQRRKLLPSYTFQVRDAFTGDVLIPDILSLLFVECVCEDSLARSCRGLLDRLHRLQLAKDMPARIYLAYDEEPHVWA